MKTVLERVELSIASGMAESFEMEMKHAKSLLADVEGFCSVSLMRGIEHPTHYLLLIEWETVEAHIAFTKTSSFPSFRDAISSHCTGKPNMEHFSQVG